MSDPVTAAFPVRRAKVCVVGAGVSGLTCARDLVQTQVCTADELLILEGSDHIGGKTHSVQFGQATIDLGASWLHGAADNPIGPLLREAGCEFSNKHDTFKRVMEFVYVFDVNGNNLTQLYDLVEPFYWRVVLSLIENRAEAKHEQDLVISTAKQQEQQQEQQQAQQQGLEGKAEAGVVVSSTQEEVTDPSDPAFDVGVQAATERLLHELEPHFLPMLFGCLETRPSLQRTDGNDGKRLSIMASRHHNWTERKTKHKKSTTHNPLLVSREDDELINAVGPEHQSFDETGIPLQDMDRSIHSYADEKFSPYANFSVDEYGKKIGHKSLVYEANIDKSQWLFDLPLESVERLIASNDTTALQTIHADLKQNAFYEDYLRVLYLLRMEEEYYVKDPLHQESFKWSHDSLEEEDEGGDLMVINGYSRLPALLAKDFTEGQSLLLNHQVVHVQWYPKTPTTTTTTTTTENDDENVENETEEDKKKRDGARFRVTCASGAVIYADYVILAVTIGVLQADVIKVSPSLPSWKHNAIQSLGNGLMNKVFLRFKTCFWGDNDRWIGYATGDPVNFGWFANMTHYGIGDNVLMAFTNGEFAEFVETSDQQAVIDMALQVLQKGYPDVDMTAEFQEIYITNWLTNPHSLGSYTYYARRSCGKHYTDVARSVFGGRLRFAGEYTSRVWNQTVHGPYMSGLRESRGVKLREDWNRKRSERALQRRQKIATSIIEEEQEAAAAAAAAMSADVNSSSSDDSTDPEELSTSESESDDDKWYPR